MAMKKTLFLWLIPIQMLILTGCNAFLEKPQPVDSIPIDEAFNSIEDVTTALRGAYRKMERLEFQLIMYPAFQSDNFNYIAGSTWDRSIVNIPFSASGGRNGAFWSDAYQLINQANLVLQTLEAEPEFGEEAERRQIEGEALFLRALGHFEMARLFARPYGPNAAQDLGVPLMLTATTSSSEITFPARASVQEVYDQVIADLQRATELLPEPFLAGRVHRYAAHAYLARVAFQKRDYALAAQQAALAMEGDFALTASPLDFFRNEGSAEEIWVIVHTPQERNGMEGRTGAGWMVLQEDLLAEGFPSIITPEQAAEAQQNQWQVVDLRRSTLTDTAGTDVVSTKYENPNWEDDIPILRLADQLLIRAEALAHTSGVNAESIALLNDVRRRALRVVDANGDPVAGAAELVEFEASDFTEATELIEAIIRERRVELLFEGNRFHELMRLQRPVRGYAHDADELRWPIPQREMDANPNLVQNPGY